MIEQAVDMIVIGGSSGSIPIIVGILEALPADYAIPLVIVVHRLKNVKSELTAVLSPYRNVREPEDKEAIQPGNIYLAPQNYHLLIEADHTFSMDYSEPVNYSRPSIDVTFTCVADVYRRRAMAILLSGANSDGANGMDIILQRGGTGIALDPNETQYPSMPMAAIKKNEYVKILSTEAIVYALLNAHTIT